VNVVEPGKRMLSSMTPTIVGKEGELVGILGTPGGPTIITSVLQVVLNKIDYRMTLDEAMSAGRFHHQWLPDSIYCEEGKISPETLEELEKRGFKFKQTGRLGDVQAIWKSGSGWEVCSDSRGTGFPVGY
jgi:gamma-glutamyltranspeptidase/glutathione hydrolase